MSVPLKIKEFPSLSNKLNVPPKKTVFERQKAEAEAKKAREDAETAAVYQDFVKSFANEEDDLPHTGRLQHSHAAVESSSQSGKGSSAPGPKRHFAPAGLKSGPGSLGPPPSSLSRKRAGDGSFIKSQSRDRGLLAFQDDKSDAKTLFQQAEQEEADDHVQTPDERAAPKPTVHLSSLPPGTSNSVIKALLPGNLHVDAVRLLSSSSAHGTNERKSCSAIVTLAKDTPASEIDAAVSSLQNKYLGLGFNLSITRHLSSAVLGSTRSAALPSTTSSQPFGAKPMFSRHAYPLSRAPPPRGTFAPPTSYGSGAQARGSGLTGPLQVIVQPPSDLKQLKLIHKTLEAVLTHGPEFEALLMTRSSVQRDEKWSWLWNARTQGGIWYRWRLWHVLSGLQTRQGSTNNAAQIIFSGGAPWQADRPLRFEYTTDFESFLSDPDYDSSEEEASGDEGDKQKHSGPDNLEHIAVAEYLNPIKKAKLTHLLARLPTSTARLRKGDVARITAFAISHAGRGSEEVVAMLIDNVIHPFAFSTANSNNKKDPPPMPRQDEDMDDDMSKYKAQTRDDPSSAALIGIYVISDLLSSSSTSGVRNAWRYRQQFEIAFQKRRLFSSLGRLERDLGWGRLRAEKWRRAVTQLLQLWEGWCVFASAAQEEFMREFEAACEGEKPTRDEDEEAKMASRKPKISAWKAVEDGSNAQVKGNNHVDEMTVDGLGDGQPLPSEDEALDGEEMLEDDDDLDGVPMESSEEDDADDQAMISGQSQPEPESAPVSEELKPEQDNIVADSPSTEKCLVAATDSTQGRTHAGRRQRPKAVDMFADSDEEK